MAHILLLTHRIPFPPDKGDKVRSYHVLRHLLQRHTVSLGTFIDSPDDWVHVPQLKALCKDVQVLGLGPLQGRLRAMGSAVRGEALSVGYYRDAQMQRWVDQTLAQGDIDATVVVSSVMAPYVLGRPEAGRLLLDFVDLDSAKWSAYAQQRRGLSAWIFGREGRTLATFERDAARQAFASYFVAEAERRLFLQSAPDLTARVRALGNGVDADFFRPAPALPTTRVFERPTVVFTGAMDYWPNVDAVQWFVREMLEPLKRQHPGVQFAIVGRQPTAAVRALAGPDVIVTGTVPDVRPYLQQASAVVAPLRVARGIQNKVLEAMACAAPVVASTDCVDALELQTHDGVHACRTAPEFVQALGGLLLCATQARQRGEQGRRCVLERFAWDAQLAALDADLDPAVQRMRAPWQREQAQALREAETV